MKRPLSLSGYILGIVSAIYSFVVNLCLGIGLSKILEETDIKFSDCPAIFQTLYVFVWLLMCFSVFSMLFNVSCVSDISLLPSRFRKYYPFFITAIIFNILTSILFVVVIILVTVCSLEGGLSIMSTQSYDLAFIGLLTTSILLIVDLVREGERREEMAEEEEDEDFEQYSELLRKKAAMQAKNKNSTANEMKSDRLNEELVKLLEMKENELLAEEDYNLLKKNLIEKYMK